MMLSKTAVGLLAASLLFTLGRSFRSSADCLLAIGQTITNNHKPSSIVSKLHPTGLPIFISSANNYLVRILRVS